MNLHFLIWEHGWQTAGWTMVYYLALGSLVALLAAALRWLLRGADPTLRYVTSLAVFATLALMPVGIAVWLSQTPASELPLTELAPAPAPQVVDLAITPPETDSALAQLQAPAALPPSEPSEHGDVRAWTAAHAIEYLPWVWLAGTPKSVAR